MEDEYTLVRSPVIDKAKWIEKLKYDVLRFSLDSIDLNLVEVGNAVNIQVSRRLFSHLLNYSFLHLQMAPIRLCMCNMHTALCNESLTLKVGAIQIRQLLRLYPGSWLEAGSISVPELRINGKFECHPPTPANVSEQLEFLRRHDQHSQRLHFLYSTKIQQPSQQSLNIPLSTTTTTAANLKRPSNAGLPLNYNVPSCACLGGSSSYYTLVQGEQFFKSSFRLSEQSTFGRSLFRPDVHVIHSHPIFERKYTWDEYHHSTPSTAELEDEEIFYPFDFCAQQKPTTDDNHDLNDHQLRHSVPADLSALSRTSSARNIKHKSFIDRTEHKRSSSSIPLNSLPSPVTSSDGYVTPNEQRSLVNSSRSSLRKNHESASVSSLTMIQQQSSTHSSPVQSHLNVFLGSKDDKDDTLSNASSTDSLTALEEILQRQQTGTNSTLLGQKVNLIKRNSSHFSIWSVPRVSHHRWNTIPFHSHHFPVHLGLVYAIK